ncbi:MAG: hypothetical protein LBR89_02695 [Holosporales bacterium]|nr:hypothetical protein [Holosporales bacterium]
MKLYDHFVITKNKYTSLRTMGIFE